MDETYPAQMNAGYAEESMLLKSNKMIYRSKIDRLKDLRKGLEEKLKQVNTAIELLESNPEFMKIQDALEKIGHI